MDFRSLSRRELQALCKRNKIPANLTNVAMVDSLKAVDTVEGIDEILQACKSQKVQSSIEPPSPYVTPAPLGVASRRRRAAKGDSAATQVGGTRRSARLAEKSARLSKGVGNGNTDHSKKHLFIAGGQEVKINLEESLDSLGEMSGVTDMEVNCERKDEQQVDSAYKQNVFTDGQPVQAIEEETEKRVELLEQTGDEISDFLKKDLSNDDGVVLKESPDGLDNITGVIGLDNTSEKNGEAQIDSSEKQDMSIDEENCKRKDEQVDSAYKQNVFTDGQPVQAIEEETEKSVELLEQTGDEISDFLKKDLSNDDGVVLKESPDGEAQIDSSEKQEMSIDEDVESIIEDQMNNISENDGAISKLKDDFSIEAKEQGDGSQDFVFTEAMNTVMEANYVEKDESEVETSVEKGDGSQDFVFTEAMNTVMEANSVEKDESEVETSVEKDESEVERVEKESLSDAVDVKTELNETRDAEIDQEGFGFEINVERKYGNEDCDDAVSLDECVTDDDVFSDDDETSDDEDSDPDENEENPELDSDSSETESGSDESDSITLDLTEESKSTKNKDSTDCMASEISSMSYGDLTIEEETESEVTTTDQVSYTDELLSEEARDELNESPTHQVAAPAPKNIITTPIAIKEVPLIFIGSNDSSFVTQPNISTPKGASASKVYERRVRMAAASDNKENVGSGSKTAPAKMRSKFIKKIAETAPMLDDNNLKKLAEDMKELHITQKSDKNEGAIEVFVRTALKVLPENRNAE